DLVTRHLRNWWLNAETVLENAIEIRPKGFHVRIGDFEISPLAGEDEYLLTGQIGRDKWRMRREDHFLIPALTGQFEKSLGELDTPLGIEVGFGLVEYEKRIVFADH